jgi:hypothetical protein
MLVKIEDLQRSIHASNRHLEELVSRRSDHNHLTSAVRTDRMKVGFQSILFSFSIEVSSERKDKQTKGSVVAKAVKKSVCTMRLPKWFMQDQYNLAIAHSRNGWLFHPSVYRSVDYHCAFFNACSRGNLKSMKMLLETKQAHLGDRSRLPYRFESDSALNIAIQCGRFEVCEFLVNAGILSFFQSSDYKTALQDLAFSIFIHQDQGREFLRLIEPEQNSDLDWLDDLEVASGSLKIIRDSHHDAANIGTDLDRFESQMFFRHVREYWSGGKLRALSKFLRDPDHIGDIRAKPSQSAWMLFMLADHLRHLCFHSSDDDETIENEFQAASPALKKMCDAGLDLHAHLGDLNEAWQDALWHTYQLRYTDQWMALDIPHVTPFTLILASMLAYDPFSTCKYVDLRRQ